MIYIYILCIIFQHQPSQHRPKNPMKSIHLVTSCPDRQGAHPENWGGMGVHGWLGMVFFWDFFVFTRLNPAAIKGDEFPY